MVFAAVTFAVVSTVHFGVDIPLGFTTVSDSFPGAAPPEAVIAAVVAIGAAAVLTRQAKSRAIALGTTGFAILGTAFGLTITLNSTRTGDVAYHLSILVALLVTLALLLVPGRPGTRPVADSGSEVRPSP
jgi:hypothetical protein